MTQFYTQLAPPRVFVLNALQQSFLSVQQAFSALNLVLNTSKTKVMWFGKKNASLPTGVITTSEGLVMFISNTIFSNVVANTMNWWKKNQFVIITLPAYLLVRNVSVYEEWFHCSHLSRSL